MLLIWVPVAHFFQNMAWYTICVCIKALSHQTINQIDMKKQLVQN